MKRKINCWEEMGCGHEPAGSKSHEYVCPAATEEQFDGVNGGKYAGRFCWCVAGTCCHGKIQGVTAKKILDCSKCSFFKKVVLEEESGFIREVELIPPSKKS